MRRRRRNALALLGGLSAVALMLGAEVARHLGEGALIAPSHARTNPQPEAEAAFPETRSFTPPAASRFSIIAERNLFSPARQPYREEPPEAPAAAPAAPATPGLDLVGVMLNGTGGVAILQPGTEKQALHLAAGDTYLGWTLTRLTEKSATLSRNGVEVTLRLEFAGRE